MKKLNKQLFKLLKLHSPSGKEWGVVSYLLPILKDTLDWVHLDHDGNLIGQKRYGNDPYTVLLSAHMDTVATHAPDPRWRKDKTEIYNANGKGALGGDDKCGIAAHLAVLRQLNRGTKFTGTVKVCFSRDEEIGCVGASKAVKNNARFFENVDCAIVIDRKGSDHIINGSFGERFCHDNYAQFWADMAKITGFTAEIQDGSISDTMIFSELGINGVNLSAGYYHAHTKDEYIDIAELRRIVNWVVNAFHHIQDYGKFPSFEYYDSTAYKPLYSWNKYDPKHDGNGFSTCYDKEWVYCDYCGWEYDEAEVAVQKDGTHICEECEDRLTMNECVNCLDLVHVDNTVDIGGQPVCSQCVKDMKLIYGEEVQ